MATYEFERPIATVDVVLFTVTGGHVTEPTAGQTREEARVQVALVPRRHEPFLGRLAIPGTYVHMRDDADLDATAARALRDKCGLKGLFVEQLRTYSGAKRDPRDWSQTTAYYALVPHALLQHAAPDITLVDADGCRGLPFDHDKIVADGLARLRGKATYSTLPTKLLPPEFTFLELEEVYEAVLGRKVRTSSFRRRLSGLMIQGSDETPVLRKTERFGGKFRPTALYELAVPNLVTFPFDF